jgi:hypothetical protein
VLGVSLYRLRWGMRRRAEHHAAEGAARAA